MKNKFLVVITYLFYFVVVAVMGCAIMYNVLKPQTPLVEADIPQSTIDWFNGIWNDTTDIGGKYWPHERDTSDWVSYDTITDMFRLEDEYFVFFYSAADSVVEYKKAKICQRYAHEAIPKGEQEMKNYPYPDQLNGRKLPIYLANTVDDYRNICQQIGHGDPGTWSIGLYCFKYGVDKVYTDGILISPRAWGLSDNEIDVDSKDEDLKQTLWHEMNHFMYFTNWDFRQKSEPCLWFTEGLAEYFAGNYDRLQEVDNYNGLNLANDFRGGGNTVYWAGLSAYLCLEKKHGKDNVYKVVQSSYKTSIDTSLQKEISGENINLWNQEWHTFMRNNEYKNYNE